MRMRNFIIILHNVISATESRRLRLAGYAHRIFVGKPEWKGPHRDPGPERRTILQYIPTVCVN
jgi:hypothetical protein